MIVAAATASNSSNPLLITPANSLAGNPTARDDREEVEAGARPSLAGRLPGRQFGKLAPGPARWRAVVGLGLRFALSAPPFGLRRAALRPRPTT